MNNKKDLIDKSQLSALIITNNEEDNIYRTLSSIWWIPEVLVVDSGSTDRTVSIASSFDNTRVIYREFDSFAKQCNFGLQQLSSDWIISLDADYVLSSQLFREVFDILSSSSKEKELFQAYRIGFRYCINGKPIRSGLLPPRTCLYRRESGEYIDVGHGHRIIINGRVGDLSHKIFHDDRKPFLRWLENQQRYQKIEATMLQSKNSSDLPIQDLIRKHTFIAPFSAFFMCIVLRGGFFDGKEGIIYAFHRLIAEGLLYIYMHSEGNE